jgi:membrane protease YdiL (CAAX protease family)
VTCLIFDLDTSQLSVVLKDPQISDKTVVIVQAFLFTVCSFLIVPTIYLWIVGNSNSISLPWNTGRMQFRLLLLTIVLAFSILPLLSILIDLNYKMPFPAWLSDLEIYFKEKENAARRYTGFLLTFNSVKDLVVAIIIVALIPGFAEEYFFRGLVQSRLHHVLKNHHYAILLSGFLFSLLHFQFYGLVPRLALGILFGYMLVWSGNIWYPIIAHMLNNSIGVLSVYLWGPVVLDPENISFFPMTLSLASIAVCATCIFFLKRNAVLGQWDKNY